MSYVAILDIGSTSVGGAIIAPPQAEVLFALRRPIVYQAQMDIERFLNDVSAAVTEVLSQLVKKSGKPKKVVCFLSAPFYAARTDWVNKTSAEPFVFTQKLLDELLAEKIKPVPGHEILESSVLNITLNGYVVTAPYGQPALEAEVSHYLSIASGKVLTQLRQAINKAAHVSDVQFHSFAFVLFRVLDELLPSRDYLALDIGGEISELSLVWKGVLRETVSYPLGQHWLIRSLAKTLGTSPAETTSNLKLFLEQRAAKLANEAMSRALETLRREWLASFRSALSEALENSFLPTEIYLLAEPYVLPLYQKWLAAEEFQNLALGSTKLGVKTVSHDLIMPLWPKVSPPVDATSLLEIIFYDKILNK